MWSANLAYIVGLIATDGSLSIDGRHINLTSKDLEQIQTFAKILKLKNKISQKRGSYSPDKTYYQIQFGNVELYRFLLEIGLTPNKTKTLGALKVQDLYFIDFLRGHLDGDGCTYSYWDSRWRSSFMLYTVFSSASKKHLEWMRETIESLYDIRGKLTFHGNNIYNLRFAKHSSMKILRKMYYGKNIPCLQRKRFKIERSLGIIGKLAGVLESVDRPA